MTKKVAYYTDKPNAGFTFGSEVMHAIHEYLGTQEFVPLHAEPTTGFESGG